MRSEERSEAIRVGAEALISSHWDGNGCGTNGCGACSRCYGPSPADAYEVAEDVVDATLSRLLDALAAKDEQIFELREAVTAGHTAIRDVGAAGIRSIEKVEADLAAALRRIEAVRALRDELLYECDNFASARIASFETGYPEISPEFWVRLRSVFDRLSAALDAQPEPAREETR